MGPPRPGRLTTRYRYEHTTAEARDGETCRLVATGTWVALLLAAAAAPAPAPPQGQATALSCRPWWGQAARSPCASGGWGAARCLRPGAARSPGAHLQPGGLVSLTSSHLLGQPGGGHRAWTRSRSRGLPGGRTVSVCADPGRPTAGGRVSSYASCGPSARRPHWTATLRPVTEAQEAT